MKSSYNNPIKSDWLSISSRVDEKNVGGFGLCFKSGIDMIYVSFDIKLESKLAKKELRVTVWFGYRK